MTTLLLTGVRPLGGPARDLLVTDGRITQVGERLAAPEGATVVDGRGHLAACHHPLNVDKETLARVQVSKRHTPEAA